jgi:predicted NAD-dependent protein-ADP-ribosyltransferase YbiA (DUF1768 family)
MASRFLRLFIDPEKLAEANRKYQERMREIEEHDADVKEAIRDAKARNKAEFHAALDRNNAEFHEKWNAVKEKA